jgi:hypothetical protein
MGMFDFLGSDDVEPQILMPDYQTAFGKQVGKRSRKYLNDFYKKNPSGMTADQLSSLQGISDLAGRGQSAGGAANSWLHQMLGGNGLNGQQNQLASLLASGGMVNPAMDETRRIAMGGDVGKNPWLSGMYDQAAGRVTDNFNKSVIPGMDTSFAQSGRLGSGAYAKLRGDAEKQLGQTLGDMGTSMYGNAYQSDMAAKNAMLGQYAGMGQQDVMNRLAGSQMYDQGRANQLGAMGQAGNVQNLRYDDLNRLYGTANQRANGYWGQMQQGAGLMGQLQGGQGIQGQQGVNGFGQLLQLGMTGAGLWAMSDRRLKRDVTRIGELPSGLPVYTYRYVWDADAPVWRVGVMADEAQEVIPHAVAEHESGYLMVDYAYV